MAMTPDSFRTNQQRPRTSASPTPSPTSTNPSPHRRRPRRRLMTEEISELYLSDHQVWPQQQAMPWPCSLNSPFLNMYGEEGEYDDEIVLAAAAQAARAATVADGGDVPVGSTSAWPLGVRRSSFASASSSDSVSDDEDPGGRVRRRGGRRGGRSAASRWSSEWIEFKTMRTASDLARSASFSALPVTAAPSVPTAAAAVPAYLLPSTFATRPLQLASAASTSTSQLPSRDCPPPPAPVRRHHHYQHHTNVAQDAPLWAASTEDLAASSTSNLTSSSPLQPRMQRPGAAQRARNRSARVILLDSSTSPILGGASPVADNPSQNTATSTFSPFSSTPEPSGTGTSGAASSSYASTVTNSALVSSIPLVRRRDHSGPFSRSESRLALARSDAAHSLLLAANAAINRDLNNMQTSDATGLPTIPTAAALLEDNGDLEEGSSLIRRVMRRRRLDRERERERDRARERERERQRDETRPLLEAEDRERERRLSRSRPRWGLSSEHNSRVEALIMDWQLIEPNAASAENGPPIIRRSPSPIDFQTESLTQESNPPLSAPAADAVGATQGAGESPTSLRPEGARAAFQIPPWRIPTSPGTGSSRPLPESTPAPTDARDVPSTSSARPSNFAQSRPSSLLPPHSSTLNVNVNLNRSSTSSSPGSSSSSGATPVRDEFRARRSPRRMDSVTDADLQAFESHLAVLRASSLTGLTPPGGLSGTAEGSSPEAGGGAAVHARSEGNSPESRSPVSTIRLPTSLGRITPRIPLSRSTAPHVDWRRHSESGQEGVPSDQSPRGTPETYFPTSRWFPPSMRRIGDGSADELVAPDAAAGMSPTAIPSDRSAEEVEQGRALARLQASQAETWTGSAAERDFQRLLNERDGSGSTEDTVPQVNETSQEVVAPTASSVAAFLGRQSEQLSNSEARLARLLEVLRTPQVGERDESRGNLSAEREGGRAPLASLRTRVESDTSADRMASSEVASSETLPTFRFTASNQDDEGGDVESQAAPETSMTVDTEMKILDLLKEEDKAQLGSSGVELVEAVDSRAASLYRSSIRSALAARARYHVPTQPRLPSTSAEYPLRFEVWQANGRDVDSVFKLNSPRGILRDDWRSWRSGQSRSASVVLRFLYIDPSSSGATATASTATAASSSSSSSATATHSDIPTGSSNPDNVLDAFARRQGERRAALAALTASGPFGRSQVATSSARASGGEASATASSSNSLTATETQQLTTHAQNLRRFLELLHEEMAVLEETFRRHHPRSEIPTGTGTRTSARTLNSAASGTARRSISAVASSFASAIPGPVSMTAYSARRAAATASTVARVQGLGDGAAGSLLPSQVRSLERLASTTGHGAERLAVVSSLGQNEIRALREIISSQVLGSGAPSLPVDSARGLLDSNEEERDVSLPEIGASGAVILPKVGLSEEEHELVQTCLDRIHSLSGMGEPSQAGLDLAFTSTGGPLQTLMQKRCEAFVRSALTAGGAQPGSIPRGRTFNMSSLELRMARRHGVEIEGLAFVSEEPMPNEVVCSFEKCDRTELVEILRSSLDRNRPGYSLLADKGARLDPSAGDAGGDIGNANLMRQWTPAAYFKTRTNYVHLDFSSGTLSTTSPNVASTSTSASASVQIRPDGRTSELGEYCVSGRFLTLILLSSATAAGRARGARGGGPVAPEEEISLNFVGAKGFGMRSTSEGRTI
ncbi:hypothetical protein CF326_g460 [Tilletia indica]|nr:hypothetical protein CF326_g460 [Tilletia indica]